MAITEKITTAMMFTKKIMTRIRHWLLIDPAGRPRWQGGAKAPPFGLQWHRNG
jgi:hypothetical protein